MRLFMTVGLFLCLQATGRGVSVDATREEVFAELGRPQSVASRGGREILLYPGGVRLELVAGRIVSAQGITLGASVALPPEASVAAPTEEVAPAEVFDDELEAAERESGYHGYADGAEFSQVELEKSFDALVAGHEQATQASLPPEFNIVESIVKMVLMFLLTIAALKLACKYWEAEVLWSGILVISVIDSLIRGGMAIGGKLLLDLPTLFYLDEAVASVVMVLLLKRMSINQSTVQAVELTMTTKTFTIVVGAFIVSMMLQSFN